MHPPSWGVKIDSKGGMGLSWGVTPQRMFGSLGDPLAGLESVSGLTGGVEYSHRIIPFSRE